MPTSFTITFAAVVHGSRQPQPHPMDRAPAPKPSPTRVQQLLDDHRPREMMNNTALVIVNQTYAALQEILGPAAPLKSSADGLVEISRPVDPADPDSPLLCVNASATHCRISLVNNACPLHGSGSEYVRYYASPRQQNGKPQYHHLPRASVGVSPGTLHIAVDEGDGRPAATAGFFACADVRPNVSEKGLFGVLETIRSRLNAAIRIEARLIEMARARGCKGPKIDEIVDVRLALERMREEVDFDAIMRRRRQKRRRRPEILEIASQVRDDAQVLAKRLRVMRISHKRCRPAPDVDQVDDAADVLTKKLRALHV